MDVLVGRSAGAHGGAAVGAGAPLSVGLLDVYRGPLGAGTWRCCSGRGSATARGMRRTCSHDAAYGHLEVLQWARAHGCSWIKRRCAENSWMHAKTNAWVCAQPQDECPISLTHQIPTRRRHMTRWRAVRGGHHEVERCAQEHGFPRPDHASYPSQSSNARAMRC